MKQLQKLAALLRLIRVHQWVKNTFVFLPVIFSGNLYNFDYIKLSSIIFVSFSLLASSIYCLNDIRDIESDRKHPVKCKRPLAAGIIGIKTVIALITVLLIVSYSLLFLLPESVILKACIIQSIYLILNVLYCFGLKNFAIIDVFIISFGFVLRTIDGGVVCGIWISPWIVCMVFLITLFIAFAKRRDDVIIANSCKTNLIVRKSSAAYSIEYLNLIIILLGAITIVCYLMYTLSPETMNRFHSQYVYITFIFVLAAILRYLMLAIVRGKSGSPTKIIYNDRFIQLCIACWLLSFGLLIYVL